MTTSERMSQGSMPWITSPTAAAHAAWTSRSDVVASAATIGAGVQTRSSVVVATIDTSALSTSVAYGPHRFETRNCVAAKLTPATTRGGPGATQPASSADDEREIRRQQHGEQRQLSPDFGAESHDIQPGDG